MIKIRYGIDCKNTITEELVNSLNDEMSSEIAKRLKNDNYCVLFDGLQDWHLLRYLAINRLELTSDYTNLLD